VLSIIRPRSLVLLVLVIIVLEIATSCVSFCFLLKIAKNESYHSLGLEDYSETNYLSLSLLDVMHS